MAFHAFLAGSTALQATPSDTVQMGTNGPAELCLELLHHSPEALLYYDKLLMSQSTIDHVYHGRADGLDAQVFRQLVDLGLIEGLDPRQYVTDLDALAQQCHVLADALHHLGITPPDATPQMLAGWLLELRIAAGRRVRPFTWYPSLNRGITAAIPHLRTRAKRAALLNGWHAELRRRFTDTRCTRREQDLRERLILDMLTCNALDASPDADPIVTRQSRGVEEIGTTATAMVLPDMQLLHGDDAQATWRAMEAVLEARERMPALRRELHRLEREFATVLAAMPPPLTPAAKRQIENRLDHHLRVTRDCLLDAYPITKQLHRLVTNPYVAWGIGYCLPGGDMALIHAASAAVAMRIRGSAPSSDAEHEPTSADGAPQSRSELWYFEYLDVRQTYPCRGWRAGMARAREWLPI